MVTQAQAREGDRQLQKRCRWRDENSGFFLPLAATSSFPERCLHVVVSRGEDPIFFGNVSHRSNSNEWVFNHGSGMHSFSWMFQ